MTAHQILKGLFILSVATIILNGFLYLGVGGKQLLYCIFGAIGMSVFTGIGTLLTKKKQTVSKDMK